MAETALLTGNEAAARAVLLCEPKVIAAYPITPQTKLAEVLSEYVERGLLKAEYVCVESEHSTLAVCIAASSAGVRVFTATSSNGLLYMHEQLHWAAGSRLPIVMCCVNRGVAAPWSIFNDQQDSFSQRDTGWIQLYCRDNQEIMDTIIQAYRISERVLAPVMVCYDGFILSHTMMPVEIPGIEDVHSFLPPYRPVRPLSPDDPFTINPVFFPWQRENDKGVLCDGYMEMRHKLFRALEDSRAVIDETAREFAVRFGRDQGGLIWDYRAGDADVIIVGMGSIATEATVAVDILRERGIAAGVVAIRAFRPFPGEKLRSALEGGRAVVAFEKCVSYGNGGGFSSDLKGALYGSAVRAPIHNYVSGLGGRDVKAQELVEAVCASIDIIDSGDGSNRTFWLNCRTE